MTSLANDARPPSGPRAPPSPLALIAESADGPTRGLETVLEPKGYRVLTVSTGRELLDRALGALPDLILVDANLPDLDGVEVCRALRQDPAIPRPTPIIMITSEAAAQRRRLAALRAGAWDCLGLPLDAEELLLKLETYVHVKMETDRVREEGSVDEASGLYTARGLERRARELVADAFRRHAALGCVALGVELELREASPAQAAAAGAAALGYAERILRAAGRASDIIGRLGRTDFAILAPATDVAGAVQLSRRLAQAIETAHPKPADVPRLRVRAGYEAVRNMRETPLEPASLLQHASAALVAARAGVNGKQIQGYESGGS